MTGRLERAQYYFFINSFVVIVVGSRDMWISIKKPVPMAACPLDKIVEKNEAQAV
jgi:hypothetical protein